MAETLDYRQQGFMRKGSMGRARWTTSMCPNCGNEPHFAGLSCVDCGCTAAVQVYISDVRGLRKMIADAHAAADLRLALRCNPPELRTAAERALWGVQS